MRSIFLSASIVGLTLAAGCGITPYDPPIGLLESPSTCGDAGTDCASNACPSCPDGALAPSSCSDRIQNALETDVDCGGLMCLPCATGKRCKRPSDCHTDFCLGETCVPSTCIDGTKAGSETDVDCGGPCAKCDAGKACATASDCASGVCTANVCQAPSCSDGQANGAEHATDCGGGCPTGCNNGTTCAAREDCASAFCRDGACAACAALADCATGFNCIAGVCTSAMASCAAQKSAMTSAPSGEYWIKPSETPIRVYCNMTGKGAQLCSEKEGPATGTMADASGLGWSATAELDPEDGHCKLWNVRATSSGHPFDFPSSDACKLMGFAGGVKSTTGCPYGSLAGTCGYPRGVLYYRYGYSCARCLKNPGTHDSYVLQGPMSTGGVMTDVSGAKPLLCNLR